MDTRSLDLEPVDMSLDGKGGSADVTEGTLCPALPPTTPRQEIGPCPTSSLGLQNVTLSETPSLQP